MGIFKPQTDEDRAAKDAAEAAAAAEQEAVEFAASPVGQARAAYAAGDAVFQADFEVRSQQARANLMFSNPTGTRATSDDPTAILNAIAREGWDLITGSFVFVEEGSTSRNKTFASGQQIAVKGVTMGYYLFRRAVTS